MAFGGKDPGPALFDELDRPVTMRVANQLLGMAGLLLTELMLLNYLIYTGLSVRDDLDKLRQDFSQYPSPLSANVTL